MTLNELISHLQQWAKASEVGDMEVVIHTPKTGHAGDWISLRRPHMDTWTMYGEPDMPTVFGIGLVLDDTGTEEMLDRRSDEEDGILPGKRPAGP